MFRQIFQLAQDLLGFGAITRDSAGVAERADIPWQVIQRRSSLELRPCFSLATFPNQAPAQDRVGESIVRIQFQSLADLRSRLLITARPVKKKGEVRIKKSV